MKGKKQGMKEETEGNEREKKKRVRSFGEMGVTMKTI